MDAGLSTLITGLIAGLGAGSAITAIIQHLLKRKEAAYDSQRKDIEARYRVVILLMYAVVDFEGNETALRINRPDLKTKQAVLKELEAEWVNMVLFASSATLKSLRSFIEGPSRITLLGAAYAMRKDLGRGAVAIKEANI